MATRLWCDRDQRAPRKLGALGLRVEGGVSYHGIALNITTNLADFDLIDPCGMPEAESTSIAARQAGRPHESHPSTDSRSPRRLIGSRSTSPSGSTKPAQAQPLAVGSGI